MSEESSKILIVDDERAHARLLSRALHSDCPEYQLAVAGNLAEARAALAESQPDLLFADLVLPDGRGTELIPENAESMPYPVVIMTSHGNEKVAVEAIRAGAFDYVVKTEKILSEIPRVAERALREWGYILERQEAEAQRAKLEAELRHSQKMEAVGTLASGIAHDFNNLLTAILGCTELVALHLSDDHPARHSLSMIEKVAEQATGVTRSLLTFAHRAPTTKAPVDLLGILAESTKLLGRLLPASIELVEELPSEPVWINADATQIQQVVMNLTVNARDAMPEGGRLTLSLHRRTAEDSGEVVLSIADTGVGICPEDQGRIFEPFFTTKERGAGTGLGLSVVHGIVTDHEGRIEIESESGQGSRFTVTLPVGEEPETASTTDAASSTRPGEGELLLVVEDNDYVLEVMASALGAAGFEVLTATDGEAAVQVFEEHRDELTLAILDLDLPKRSGASCGAEMGRQRPDLPVVFVTGNIDRASRAEIGEDTPVLSKPFKISELLERIEKALHGD